MIVRVDGGGIPPPDDGQPEGEQHPHDDAADWTYHRPRGEHAGMGMPYYGKDGSLRWDRGVRNMPADGQSLPPEYRRCLWKGVHYDIVRYAIAAMLRQNPNANRSAAGRAVRRYLARAGLPDRTQDGWEEALLAGVWGGACGCHGCGAASGPARARRLTAARAGLPARRPASGFSPAPPHCAPPRPCRMHRH